MADDKSLKSAYELAMERFRKSDAQAGIEPRPLTDEQKAAIAEIRSFYKAKAAELEVLHESGQRKTMEPAAREALDQEYRRERERLSSDQDAKIEKVRGGKKP
jgi:hypothetical protein